MSRALVAWLVLSLLPTAANANGTLTGKLDLPPPPERPAVAAKGFLDRIENPLAPVKPVATTQRMVVVAYGSEVPVSPPQVVIELLGETFSRKVVAAPAGAEVVIKNVSRTARTLVADEDPTLIPQGPINPTGPKSFRVTEVDKIYTIGDKDAPHLKTKVIVVNTQYVGYPDDNGKFEIPNMPPGAYKVKVWYGEGWIDRPDDTVEVGAKGKTELNPKIPAAAFAPVKK
jgi:hypothetical protein